MTLLVLVASLLLYYKASIKQQYSLLTIKQIASSHFTMDDRNTTNPYSHAEWAHSNLERFRAAEDARVRSETLRNDAVKLVEDREIRTTRSQTEATNRLNDRARDVSQWKKELQKELEALNSETMRLKEIKKELEHAMEQAKRPEEVVNHCLEAREYRVGIDFVQDNVVSALKAEMGEIQRIRAAMKQHHDDIESQLMTNDNIATRLRVDLSQKRTALDIDQDCFILDNSSHEINHHPGIHHADLTNSNPQSWIKHSDRNMEDSNNARKASAALKGNVEGLMSSACTELSTAWSITNRSFKERILETEETSGLISKHLDNIAQEIVMLDDHIKLLKKGLADKQPPLKVAETRLALRTHRPNVEACDDAPHGTLISEVVEINDSIAILTQKLADAEEARVKLLKSQSELREDRRVKEASLRIDRGKCMGKRLRFPYNQRCSRKCGYKWCSNIANFTMARASDGLHLADTDLRQYNQAV